MKYHYPGQEEHIKEHNPLVESVLNLKRNKTYLFADNVAQFLNTWLKEHIIEKDMQYKDFLKKKGIQ